MKRMDTWKNFFNSTYHLLILTTSVLILIITLYFFREMLLIVDTRQAFVINDFIIAKLKPIDFSLFIFPVTYIPILIGIIKNLKYPYQALLLIQTYLILIMLRMTCIHFIPLVPPPNIIPLNDPILKSSMYGGGAVLCDLFFSGHVATIILFSFLEKGNKYKYFFFSLAIVLSVMLVWQHVHYTIDVISAPFFAGLAYLTAFKLLAILKIK